METNYKFKVGDKVRRLKKWCDLGGFEENKVYTITKVYDLAERAQGYMDIDIKETIGVYSFQGPWDSNKFKLVERKVQYQIGKFYKNKIGGAVHECVDMTLGGLPVMKNTRNDGGKVFIYQGENLEEYTPPRTGKLWLNVYSDSDLYLYETRESADRHAGSDRLACVEVNWTEGQGL